MNTELVSGFITLWLSIACIFYVIDSWRTRRRDRRIIQRLQVIRAQTYESDTVEMAEEIANMLGVDINGDN